MTTSSFLEGDGRDLRELIACPVCLSTQLSEEGDDRLPAFLLCASCHAVFPIEQGTPRMLDYRALVRLPVELLAAWRATQLRALPLYESNDRGSCSSVERDDVQQFRRFVNLSGKTVLDVGSGSFAVPGYAEGAGYYADGRGYDGFVGIDPIPPRAAPGFPLVVAIGERLPFRDDAFDAVLLATSLDHALDVTTTLREVHRVLVPNGEVYFWGMFVADESLTGRGVGTPALPRVHEPPFDARDPVGAYLETKRRYDAATAQLEGDEELLREHLVDEFHFRHFDRRRLIEELRRERLVVAQEDEYRSDAGDLHSFLRLVKASPEQVAVHTLAAALRDEREAVLGAQRSTLESLVEDEREGRAAVVAQAQEAAAAAAEERRQAAELEAARHEELLERLDNVTAQLADTVLAVRTLTDVTIARPSELRRFATRLRLTMLRRTQRLHPPMRGARRAVRLAPPLIEAARAHRRAPRGGNRILMLTISQITIDPRINKVAKSLAERDFEVDIMAFSDDGAAKRVPAAPGVQYVMVPHDPMKPFFIYQDEFQRAARDLTYDYVHANDLTTLGVAGVLARTRGVPLVYDAHELWTENVEFNGREWVPMSNRMRRLASVWEGRWLRYVDILITVGPSLVREFERRYQLKRPPLFLPNYPSLALLDRPKQVSIRTACGLGDDAFVTLYMGGVNPLRNIEGVVRAHRHLPENHVFVVMGPGVDYYEDEYRALAAAEGVADRVFFLPSVPMDEVVTTATEADCGIVMLRNICRNFYWFYPNKLFEYALAGIPIAASGFPDVKQFVEGQGCGVTFDPDSPRSIAQALQSLADDPVEARAMGERGRASIVGGLNWESAVEDLAVAYRSLIA